MTLVSAFTRLQTGFNAARSVARSIHQVRYRSALVTGGSKGLGEAIVRRLLSEEGYSHITIADVDEVSGRRLVLEFPSKLQFIRTDVSKPEDVANAVEQAATFSDEGVLHALVNNAGVVGPQQTYAEYDLDEWHRVLNINLNGVFYGLKYGLAHMVSKAAEMGANGEDPNFAIVNLSSTAGFRGLPLLGAYTASKWAVRGMTQAAGVEYAQHKIRVNAIAPTSTETTMISQFIAMSSDPEEVRNNLTAMNALPGLTQPQDVADACAFLLSRNAKYITGHTLPVDAGALSRLV